MFPKQKFQKRTLIPIGLFLFFGYKGLEALTTPDSTPPIAEITKLIKQVAWVKGFEQVDGDYEAWAGPDERADNALFSADLHYVAGSRVEYIATDDLYRRRVVPGVSEAGSEFVLRVPKGREILMDVSFKCEMFVRTGIAPLFNKPVFMKCAPNEASFDFNVYSGDYGLGDAIEGDVAKSGGLYLGADIKARFPHAKKTIKLLEKADLKNNRQ